MKGFKRTKQKLEELKLEIYKNNIEINKQISEFKKKLQNEINTTIKSGK